MLVEVDIPQEQTEAFRAMCDANGIKIQYVKEQGPGGPCFHLLVDAKAAFAALGKFYWELIHEGRS